VQLAQGLKVGLLDADIYGPSIQLLVTPDDPEAKVKRSARANFVLPLDAEGLKVSSALMKWCLILIFILQVLSFGHVSPRAGVVGAGGQGAAVIRGPVATRVINQLAAATDWGELDYLIVDFPPGTGDVPLTLCQSLVISGAAIISTPHPVTLRQLC
jgi:Mrp family chromosome partitioning ATPase